MANDVMIPQGLAGPDQAFGATPDERLSEGIEGSAYPIIGTNGKTFYLKYRGQKKTITSPTPDPVTKKELSAQHLDFVLLRKNKLKSHTWYEHGYQDGLDNVPDCSSTDGVGPDDSSPKPQSQLCEVCPQHVWKVQPSGREGRACSDNLRTAILPLGLKHMFGEDIAEPVFFRIPAASLTALGNLGDQMMTAYGSNTRYSSYIIRATFKDGVKWQQFEYQVLDFLKGDWVSYVLKLRDDPQAFRILGVTPGGQSMTRTGKALELKTVQQIAHQPAPRQLQERPVADQGALGDRLAAERAERIAAVRAGATAPPRQPQTIDVVPNEVPQQQQSAPPWDEQVPETTGEIDDVIGRMGSPPPRGA